MINLSDKLREKIVDAETSLIGNRVTAAGRATFTSIIPILYNTPKDRNEFEAFAYLALTVLPIVIWGVTESQTGSGEETKRIYNKTKEHIKGYGKIKEKFAKKILSYDGKENIESKSVIGYCEWQGMYLASKALGKLDQFNKLKEKYYKKPIPLI